MLHIYEYKDRVTSPWDKAIKAFSEGDFLRRNGEDMKRQNYENLFVLFTKFS